MPDLESWNSASLAEALADLGYSGFAVRSGGRHHNPAVVLLAAISRDDLEVRVVESLPWLAFKYHALDWNWLMEGARSRNVQNRLGFIVTLGRRVAANTGSVAAERRLLEVEEALKPWRLALEDTLCQAALSEAERRWLRDSRPADARYWNLLTDLEAEHLPYAA